MWRPAWSSSLPSSEGSGGADEGSGSGEEVAGWSRVLQRISEGCWFGDGVRGDVAVALRLEDHERVALGHAARVSVNLDFFYLAGLLADVLDLNVADARRQALDVDGGRFEAVVHGCCAARRALALRAVRQQLHRSSMQQTRAAVVGGAEQPELL